MRLAVLAMFLLWTSPALSEEPNPPRKDVARPDDSTLELKPPEGGIKLLHGEDLEGWVKGDGKTPAAWTFEDGIMTVKPGQGAIMTRKKLGDARLHVEFNVPYMPKARGQGRGNSGVFLTGTYEVQVLDSYGLKLQKNDCGALYNQVLPSANVCKPPLQWQSYDIEFRRARVDGGKVVKKARITVVQNGIKTIDNAEIDITPGGMDTREGEDGPIFLQDHGNEVQYRNIWILPLD